MTVVCLKLTSFRQAPFEILIAGIFLYQYVFISLVPTLTSYLLPLARILGISAFAGFVFLILGLPLNSWLDKRSIRIHKGLLRAREKRMDVMNEIIGAVRNAAVRCILYSHFMF